MFFIFRIFGCFWCFCGKYYNNQYSHYKQTPDKYRLFGWVVNCSFYSFSVCVSCLIYIARIWSFFKKNRTQNISIIRGFGVILNLFVKLYFNHLLSTLIGAAIATTVSYFMMSFIIYSWNKSFFNFQYDWKIVFIITVFMASSWLLSSHALISLKAALLILYILLYPKIQNFSSNDLRKRK